MTMAGVHLTGRERFFPEDEIIVSKTDPKGRLVYVNDVFLAVSGYTEAELLGQPHSIVRHPATPRCLFRLMWDRIQAGRETFVYVNNRAKTGDHYWVLAHVTPNCGENGEILGYHSNRRVPRRDAITKLVPLYDRLRAEEERYENRKAGMDAAGHMLTEHLTREGRSYEEFVLAL